MNKSMILMITILLVLLVTPGVFATESLPEIEVVDDRVYVGEGYMEILGPVVFMHLKGSAYEMGLQHGRFLTHLVPDDSLMEMGERFNPLSAQASGIDALIQGFRNFYFRYKMYPWILRNTPEEYYQELSGIIYGVSHGEETDPMPMVMGNASQDLGLTFGCTSIVAFGDATSSGSLYHARNLDHIEMIDIAQFGFVTVFEPDEGYPFITHIYPVHAGTMQAMNNQGITVSINYSLGPREDTALDGMPMVILMRKIAQYARTLDEAIEIVLNTPRTFGMNIAISDSKGPDAVVLEVDADRYAIRRAHDGALYSANRYNTTYMQQFQESGWLASATREKTLKQFFEANHGQISVESLVDLLRSRGGSEPMSEHNLVSGINNAGTLLSAVFSPDEQMVWIALLDEKRGAADNEFFAFSLEKALDGQSPKVFERNIPEVAGSSELDNWLLVRKATIAQAQNRPQRTLDYLHQVDEAYAEDEGVLPLKGRAHLRLGHVDSAEAIYLKLATRSDVFEPYYKLEAAAILGVISDTRGDREDALLWYQLALDVEIADLGGDSTFYQQIAEVGLQRPVYIEFSDRGYSFSTRDNPIVSFFRSPPVEKSDPKLLFSEYEGKNIANIRVLGDHVTNEAAVRRIIGLKENTAFNPINLNNGYRRLQALDALDMIRVRVIPISDNEVDVVIRISEGFGFYLDPVALVIDTALNAANKSIAARYYNVGGTLASIAGEYNFGPSNKRGVYVTLPFINQPSNIGFTSQSITQSVLWGQHKDSKYSLDRKDISFESQIFFASYSSLRLTGQYSQTHVTSISSTSGLQISDNDYLSAGITWQSSIPGNTWLTRAGSTIQINGSLLADAQDLTELYPRIRIRARNLTYLGGGFVSRIEVDGAWTEEDTPFDRQLRLGGNGKLGAISPMFVGEKYVYSNLELQRYFSHDFSAHANLELSKVWEDGSDWSLMDPLYSIGVGITYNTPIDLQIRAQYSTNLALENVHTFYVGVHSPF